MSAKSAGAGRSACSGWVSARMGVGAAPPPLRAAGPAGAPPASAPPAASGPPGARSALVTGTTVDGLTGPSPARTAPGANAPGASAAAWALSNAAGGRSPGSLARAAVSSGSRDEGAPVRSGCPFTMR